MATKLTDEQRAEKRRKNRARRLTLCRIEFTLNGEPTPSGAVGKLVEGMVNDDEEDGKLEAVYCQLDGDYIKGLVFFASATAQVEKISEVNGRRIFDVTSLAANESLGSFALFMVNPANGRGIMTKYHGDGARKILQKCWHSIAKKAGWATNKEPAQVAWSMALQEVVAILAAAKEVKELTIPVSVSGESEASSFSKIARREMHTFSLVATTKSKDVAEMVEAVWEENKQMMDMARAVYVAENGRQHTLDFDNPLIPAHETTMAEFLAGDRVTDETYLTCKGMANIERMFSDDAVKDWLHK